MADPFLAEIRMFAGNFAPRNWATCDGQTLPIQQNTALFSLLGVNYGGNGTSTYGLPNLQGSAPMDQGDGAGLTPRSVGETGGSASVTLTLNQMAGHVHTLQGRPSPVNQAAPAPTTSLGSVPPTGNKFYKQPSGASLVPMNPQGTGLTGGSGPHNNLQPYLGLTFIIATSGIFPQRP